MEIPVFKQLAQASMRHSHYSSCNLEWCILVRSMNLSQVGRVFFFICGLIVSDLSNTRNGALKSRFEVTRSTLRARSSGQSARKPTERLEDADLAPF
jgi:hypothetical protein